MDREEFWLDNFLKRILNSNFVVISAFGLSSCKRDEVKLSQQTTRLDENTLKNLSDRMTLKSKMVVCLLLQKDYTMAVLRNFTWNKSKNWVFLALIVNIDVKGFQYLLNLGRIKIILAKKDLSKKENWPKILKFEQILVTAAYSGIRCICFDFHSWN